MCGGRCGLVWCRGVAEPARLRRPAASVRIALLSHSRFPQHVAGWCRRAAQQRRRAEPARGCRNPLAGCPAVSGAARSADVCGGRCGLVWCAVLLSRLVSGGRPPRSGSRCCLIVGSHSTSPAGVGVLRSSGVVPRRLGGAETLWRGASPSRVRRGAPTCPLAAAAWLETLGLWPSRPGGRQRGGLGGRPPAVPPASAEHCGGTPQDSGASVGSRKTARRQPLESTRVNGETERSEGTCEPETLTPVLSPGSGLGRRAP